MKPRWKRSHVIEMVLLLTGSVLLGVFLWDRVATEIDQRQADMELEQQTVGSGEEPTPPGTSAGTQPQEEAEEAEAQPRQPPETPREKAERKQPRTSSNRGALIGRIEIPRLKIKAVVRSGVDNRTLKRAVGHVPNTPMPGQPGNVGLAAHRDTFFRNLKGVRNGDTIRIVTPKGAFAYEVESTQIVWPKNVEVLYPTVSNVVTLVTCYPFNYVGSAPKRFIVRAKQVSRTEIRAGL